MIGEAASGEAHEGLVSFAPKRASLALTSKVKLVLMGKVSSQNRASHLVPGMPESRTREAIVPEVQFAASVTFPELEMSTLFKTPAAKSC